MHAIRNTRLVLNFLSKKRKLRYRVSRGRHPGSGGNQKAIRGQSSRDAINGNRRQSEAISAKNQRQSMAIRGQSGHQWQSVAISGNQWQSVAEMRGNQWQSVVGQQRFGVVKRRQSEAIRDNQTQSEAIICHQWRSVAIGGNQRQSEAISGRAAPWNGLQPTEAIRGNRWHSEPIRANLRP